MGKSNKLDLVNKLENIRDLLDGLIISMKNQPTKKIRKTASPANVRPLAPHKSLDFSMPLRAFAKKYAKNMSGPKIFVLLVAHCTGGDSSKRVGLTTLEGQWNKLKGVLGMKFNGAHSIRARENDWVATEKTGSYYLRPGWKEILT